MGRRGCKTSFAERCCFTGGGGGGGGSVAQSCPPVCSPMDCSQASLSITGTKNQIRVWKIGKSRRVFLAEETALAKA